MNREKYHAKLDTILDVILKKEEIKEDEVKVELNEEGKIEIETELETEVETELEVDPSTGEEIVIDPSTEEIVIDPSTEEIVIESEVDLSIFNVDVLKDKIDFGKDGYHTIEFSIEDGKVIWGDLMSQSYTELKTNLSKEIEDKSQEIEDLKIKFEKDLEILSKTITPEKIITAPVEGKTVAKTPLERKIETIIEQRKELN